MSCLYTSVFLAPKLDHVRHSAGFFPFNQWMGGTIHCYSNTIRARDSCFFLKHKFRIVLFSYLAIWHDWEHSIMAACAFRSVTWVFQVNTSLPGLVWYGLKVINKPTTTVNTRFKHRIGSSILLVYRYSWAILYTWAQYSMLPTLIGM